MGVGGLPHWLPLERGGAWGGSGGGGGGGGFPANPGRPMPYKQFLSMQPDDITPDEVSCSQVLVPERGLAPLFICCRDKIFEHAGSSAF